MVKRRWGNGLSPLEQAPRRHRTEVQWLTTRHGSSLPFLDPFMSNLERLDRDLVGRGVECRAAQLARPAAAKPPRHHRLPSLVEQRDPAVGALHRSLEYCLDPVPQRHIANHPALQRDVREPRQAGYLPDGVDLPARSVLNRNDFYFEARHLGEAPSGEKAILRYALYHDLEVEPRIGILALHGHGRLLAG